MLCFTFDLPLNRKYLNKLNRSKKSTDSFKSCCPFKIFIFNIQTKTLHKLFNHIDSFFYIITFHENDIVFFGLISTII